MKSQLFALLLAAGWAGASAHAQENDAAQKAFVKYQAKAENGNAAAQYYLGNSYLKGEGVERNPTEAVKWYRKAAEQNVAAAQLGLGACYARGVGVARDAVEGMKWYRKSAEQGNAIAQFNLGICYYDGLVVEQDYTESYVWFSLAAQTDKDAGDFRDIVEKVLTRQQLAEGKKRMEELRVRIEERKKGDP